MLHLRFLTRMANLTKSFVTQDDWIWRFSMGPNMAQVDAVSFTSFPNAKDAPLCLKPTRYNAKRE